MAFPGVTSLWGRRDTWTVSHLGQVEQIAETLETSGRRGHREPATRRGPRSFPHVPPHSWGRAWGRGRKQVPPAAWPGPLPRPLFGGESESSERLGQAPSAPGPSVP